MEFTLPSSLGAQATLMAQRPTRPAPDPSRVEKSPAAGEARADSHNARSHGDAQNLNKNGRRDTVAQPLDPDQPVGPPPTFQMNVLEMERELHQRLAQIELERTLSEDRTPASVNALEDDNKPDAPAIHQSNAQTLPDKPDFPKAVPKS